MARNEGSEAGSRRSPSSAEASFARTAASSMPSTITSMEAVRRMSL